MTWKGSNWHHDWKVVDDTSRWRSSLPAIELGSRFHSPSLKGHKLPELPGSPASNMFKWIGTFRNFRDPKTDSFLWIPRINQLALSFWCPLMLAWVSRTSTTSGENKSHMLQLSVEKKHHHSVWNLYTVMEDTWEMSRKIWSKGDFFFGGGWDHHSTWNKTTRAMFWGMIS